MSHHPKMCLSYLLLTDVLRQLWLNGLEHNAVIEPILYVLYHCTITNL